MYLAIIPLLTLAGCSLSSTEGTSSPDSATVRSSTVVSAELDSGTVVVRMRPLDEDEVGGDELFENTTFELVDGCLVLVLSEAGENAVAAWPHDTEWDEETQTVTAYGVDVGVGSSPRNFGALIDEDNRRDRLVGDDLDAATLCLERTGLSKIATIEFIHPEPSDP